jgi:hypothetical protein
LPGSWNEQNITCPNLIRISNTVVTGDNHLGHPVGFTDAVKGLTRLNHMMNSTRTATADQHNKAQQP